jgi:hypothetical protein
MMRNYSTRWIHSITLVATLSLGACGELAYKRGASASDLASTRKSCMAKDSATEAVKKCMSENGWVVQNLDNAEPIATMQNEPDPVIDASVTEDNRQFKNPTASTKISTINPLNTSPVIKKPADPMDTFKIGSWWKLGADADNLKNSINSCVMTLGKAHQPDPQTKQVTRGLLMCMKEKGWHGLREK